MSFSVLIELAVIILHRGLLLHTVGDSSSACL